MPCWKLVATNSAKKALLTKGGTPGFKNNYLSGYSITNYPMEFVIHKLYGYKVKPDEVYIDATGIKGNIDLSVDAILTEPDEYLKALQKNGLNLVRDEKEMKVIVVSDSSLK